VATWEEIVAGFAAQRNDGWHELAAGRIAELAPSVQTVATDFAAPQPLAPNWRDIQAHRSKVGHAGQVLDGLDDAQLLAVCTALHPKLGAALARCWVDARSQPVGADQRFFRNPTDRSATRWSRSCRLKAAVEVLGPFDRDVEWLAEHAGTIEHAALGLYEIRDFREAIGPLLAAGVDVGGAAGDAALEALIASTEAGATAGVLSDHAITALAMCARPQAWETVDRLLIGAQRQEGLRLTILNAAPQAHPEQLLRMLDIVVAEDLARFASVVRAVCDWIGLDADVTDLPAVRRHVAQLAALLRDAYLVERTVRTDEPWDAYVAMCATAAHDVVQSEPLIASLLARTDRDLRATGLQFAQASGRRRAEFLDCLDDPDLHIAMLAYYCLGSGYDDDSFDRLERLVRRLPVKATSVPGLGVDQRPILLSRAPVLEHMFTASRHDPSRVLPWLGDADTRTRDHFARTLGEIHRKQGSLAPELRATLVALMGDRSSNVRSSARCELFGIGLTEADLSELEALLTRKPGDLRAGSIQMILSYPQDDLLASAERLWRGTGLQRDAACEVLAGAPRRTPAIVATAAAFAADGPTPRQLETLSTVTVEWTQDWMNDPGLGLYDPARRAPISQVSAPERSPMTTDTSWRIIEALDDFVEMHRDTPVVFEFGSSVLLGDLPRMDSAGRFELPGSPLDGRDVAEVLDTWWAERPDDLRETDCVDALRAFAAISAPGAGLTPDELAAVEQHPRFQEHRWWFDVVSSQVVGEGVPLRHRDFVHFVLRRQVHVDPAPEVIDLCLAGLTDVLAAVPAVKFDALPPAEVWWDSDPREWRGEVRHLVWSKVLTELFRTRPDAFTPRQIGTWWRLCRWLDEPHEGVRRQRPPDELTLRAHADGHATDDDVLDMLYQRGHQLFSSWTRRRPDALAQQNPSAVALAHQLRERVVELERTRGDLGTQATELAARVQYFDGASAAVDLLARLGPGSLVRGYGDHRSRRAALSHLVRVSHPETGEDGKALRSAAADADVSSEQLIELALYAPQWAELVESAIGWTGLADTVWWYHAHTKDHRWGIDREIRESWAASIAERTPLSADDLLDGAVDVDWFLNAHRRLGATRWQTVHELTALAAAGSGYLRAKGFAEAMLGEADEAALLKRIRTKRHQDSIRSLGLLPLPTTAKKRDATVLARYGVIREFERTSRKFGSQRRESEGTAARIGVENLARTAGHTDAQRFSWAMEAAEAGALADGPITATEGDVTVVLSVDHEGTPEIAVSRAGTTLKSVPAKLRKVPVIAELTERRTQLTRQASRIRHSLEASMIAGERFERADLDVLDRHPVVSPMLEQLLFVDDSDRIARRRCGGQFESVNGAPVASDGRLRLAHPVDLLTAEWAGWQSALFDDATRQPFRQAFRELYVPTESERALSRSTRWVGQQVQQATARALLASRGWLSRHDEETSLRVFHSHHIAAWVDIAGWGELGAVELPTIGSLSFTHLEAHRQLTLEQVPPVVFSEAMRDLDLVVSVAHASGVRPETSASTVEVRAAVVRETARLMRLQNVRFVGEHHAVIDGTLGEYSVHLGSGTVHRRPGGSIVLIPADAQRRGRLFLPFLDDDPATAFVVSAVVLLARDDEIQDPTVLVQLRS